MVSMYFAKKNPEGTENLTENLDYLINLFLTCVSTKRSFLFRIKKSNSFLLLRFVIIPSNLYLSQSTIQED